MPREYQFFGTAVMNVKFIVTADSEQEAHSLVEGGRWDDVVVELPHEIGDTNVDMESCEVVDSL